MCIEIIKIHLLSFGDIIHEIVLLDVINKDHNNLVIFNVIRSPTNIIILRLS